MDLEIAHSFVSKPLLIFKRWTVRAELANFSSTTLDNLHGAVMDAMAQGETMLVKLKHCKTVLN